jgi:putative membrane protein
MDGFWGNGFMMIIWLIFIIVGVVILMKWLTEKSSSSLKEESALDILKKRYARGEITREQFENMKKDIS